MKIFYDGGYRIIEPYCYGINKVNNESIRAYQIIGHSNSGKPENFKLFKVEKIETLQILDENFIPNHPLYNKNDKGMKEIYIQI
jgi:hypothetical protein